VGLIVPLPEPNLRPRLGVQRQVFTHPSCEMSLIQSEKAFQSISLHLVLGSHRVAQDEVQIRPRENDAVILTSGAGFTDGSVSPMSAGQSS